MNLATRKTMKDISTVEANGKKIIFPNILNRTSPGKRPIPSFSSQGNVAENITSAMKIVMVQRIMRRPSKIE
jgi:hypothetical protein